MNAPSPIPAGVLTLLGESALLQRQTEQRCLDMLIDRDFKLVHLPVLEYADGIDASGYRFVDRAGRLLALRTDFTPAASRVLTPTMEAGLLPLSVCYAGEVIRPQPARLRQLPELYQLGFESYGVEGGMGNALGLTLELLRIVGVAPNACHMTLCVAGMAERILAQLLEEPPDEELIELLRVRDLESLAQVMDIRGSSRRALEAALLGEEPSIWADALGAHGDLEMLAPFLDLARGQGLGASVDVAPRLAGAYYRGVVFSIWGGATRAVIAAGGEYQVPLRHRALPAVGACMALGIAMEEALC